MVDPLPRAGCKRICRCRRLVLECRPRGALVRHGLSLPMKHASIFVTASPSPLKERRLLRRLAGFFSAALSDGEFGLALKDDFADPDPEGDLDSGAGNGNLSM